MSQFEFVEWLATWLFSQEEFFFEWDSGNEKKSKEKHDISVESAEELFENLDFLLPLGIQISPDTNEPRFGVLGMDFKGKLLMASFTIREGRIRVISIRAMIRTERRNYESIRKK